MKRSVVMVLSLCLLSSVPAAVEADDEPVRETQWARDDDGKRCLEAVSNGDDPQKVAACWRLHWTYYLWPQIAHLIREFALLKFVDPEIPDWDPLPSDILDARIVTDWNKPQPRPTFLEIFQLEKQHEVGLTQKDVKTALQVHVEQLELTHAELLNAADAVKIELVKQKATLKAQ